MGYQESFITCSNPREQRKLINFLSIQNEKYFEQFWLQCVAIMESKNIIMPQGHWGITKFKEHTNWSDDISILSKYDLKHLPDAYPKGSQFIYLVGERGGLSFLLIDLINKNFSTLDNIYLEELSYDFEKNFHIKIL
ncbi:MAG: hypothetical protein ACOCQR_01775 [bacterium]